MIIDLEKEIVWISQYDMKYVSTIRLGIEI